MKIKKRIKFDTIKDKIDGVMIQRIVIAILVVTILLIMLLSGNKISILEEETLKSYSNKMINYIEKGTKDEDYIISAVKYYYNEENKTSISLKEVSKYIKENYNKKISEKEMKNIGISEKLMKEKIMIDIEKSQYNYRNEKTLQDIANTKIYTYKIKEINKLSENKYEIEYQKYVIENPYEVLNYYQGKKDITKINNYIMGKGTTKEFLESINEKDLSKFAKKKNQVTVEYEVINRSLTISKIK